MAENRLLQRANRLRPLPAEVAVAAIGGLGLFAATAPSTEAATSPASKHEYLHYKTMRGAVASISRRLVSPHARVSFDGEFDIYWKLNKKGHFTRRTLVPPEAVVDGKKRYFAVTRQTDPADGEALSLQVKPIPRDGWLGVQGKYTYGPATEQNPGFTLEDPLTTMTDPYFNEYGRPVADVPYRNQSTEVVTTKTVPLGRTYHINVGAVIARAGDNTSY